MERRGQEQRGLDRAGAGRLYEAVDLGVPISPGTLVVDLQVQLLISAQDVENYKVIKSELDRLRITRYPWTLPTAPMFPPAGAQHVRRHPSTAPYTFPNSQLPPLTDIAFQEAAPLTLSFPGGGPRPRGCPTLPSAAR